MTPSIAVHSFPQRQRCSTLNDSHDRGLDPQPDPQSAERPPCTSLHVSPLVKSTHSRLTQPLPTSLFPLPLTPSHTISFSTSLLCMRHVFQQTWLPSRSGTPPMLHPDLLPYSDWLFSLRSSVIRSCRRICKPTTLFSGPKAHIASESAALPSK